MNCLKIQLATDLEIILSDHQNNYAGVPNKISNAIKSLDILVTSLSVLHNYFRNPIKILSDQYLAKFLGRLGR